MKPALHKKVLGLDSGATEQKALIRIKGNESNLGKQTGVLTESRRQSVNDSKLEPTSGRSDGSGRSAGGEANKTDKTDGGQKS